MKNSPPNLKKNRIFFLILKVVKIVLLILKILKNFPSDFKNNFSSNFNNNEEFSF